jgi:signal transduction histidine kinase
MGVAHDFGNVLQGIELIVAELQRASRADRVRLEAELTRIASSGTALVQALRSFVRAPRQGDRCDARDVLVQLETMIELLCRRTAEVRLDIGPEPVWVAISRTDLERVVLNLVLNARDAIEGLGHISLGLRPSADQVVIEVRDDGAGISQELLVEVFQPYFTTKAQGTGLGLATVRTIVEAAGGHVTVTSQPGHGSCFTVTVRRVEAPGAAW